MPDKKLCFLQTFHLENHFDHFLAHLSLWLSGELIVYQSSRRPSVHPSTLSNMNISQASRPIAIKFYLKHHWSGGKAAWRFDADQFRTLVSMATDSFHRVIMGKTYLQVTMTCMRAWMSSKFGRI